MPGADVDSGRLWRGDGLSRIPDEPRRRPGQQFVDGVDCQPHCDQCPLWVRLTSVKASPARSRTPFDGCLLGLLYLTCGRNLWAPIIAHGITDTVDMYCCSWASIRACTDGSLAPDVDQLLYFGDNVAGSRPSPRPESRLVLRQGIQLLPDVVKLRVVRAGTRP